MKLNDDILKELYQGYVDLKTPFNRKNCPSSIVIASSFEPSVSRRKKKKIIDHISECSYCREEFMFFFELQKCDFMSNKMAFKTINYDSQIRANNFKIYGLYPFWRYVCFFLGFVLIISSILLFIRRDELSDTRRTNETSIMLIYPTLKHTLPSPLIFQWQKRSSSQYYILELFDDALLPIWISNKIYDSYIQLPADIYSKLLPEKAYFWTITAFIDTSIIEESKLTRFIVFNKE